MTKHLDHQILRIQPNDAIFRICSAGDIVLDYAIEGPARIVMCDMNQHQLWLFELKIRIYGIHIYPTMNGGRYGIE
jgi:betaine lipid synthase